MHLLIMQEKEAENVDAILVHSDCGISSGILELSENWSAERPGEDAFRDIWTGLTLVGSVRGGNVGGFAKEAKNRRVTPACLGSHLIGSHLFTPDHTCGAAA